VPEVLLSGDHEAITRWREQQSRDLTARLRPDLLPLRGTVPNCS
jgi:tRNA (guanine37-N1)-methyltransferase